MPIEDGRAWCPWCRWSLDITSTPFTEETARRKLKHHMDRCPRRRSPAHTRSHVDVHGQNPFEDNANY